jgi:DNA-binding NarL/FixJ family response regulator
MDVMGLAAFEERLFATPNNAPDEQILKFLAAGYSVPEIAELTGLGKRQVSNRVYRIRRLLRERGLAA